jgi:hypothetical protein
MEKHQNILISGSREATWLGEFERNKKIIYRIF